MRLHHCRTAYTLRRFAFVIIVIAFGSGCQAIFSYKEHPITPHPSIPAVSSALVVVDHDRIANPQIELLKANKVDKEIQRTLGEMLRKAGLIDPSSKAVMRVKVVRFRLRSEGAAWAAPNLTGLDRIGVEVSVERKGVIVDRYPTSVESRLGGFNMSSYEFRLGRLVPILSERIIVRETQ